MLLVLITVLLPVLLLKALGLGNSGNLLEYPFNVLTTPENSVPLGWHLWWYMPSLHFLIFLQSGKVAEAALAQLPALMPVMCVEVS